MRILFEPPELRLSLCAVFMALALTACGGGNTTVVAPTPDTPATPTPTTPTTPPATEAGCTAANTRCAPQP